MDDCGRVWFVNVEFGLRIYNAAGSQIANWNMNLNASNTIYDILLLPDYVLLVTYKEQKQIVRFDPQLNCNSF